MGPDLIFRIENLAAAEAALPAVASWQQSEFGYLDPTSSLERRVSALRASLRADGLPRTLVAMTDDGRAVGSATLVARTLTHSHLAPWLSMVVVPPEHRRRGVASALARRALHEAAGLGFDTLYLFTPRHESLYARLGWRPFERVVHAGVPLTLMSRAT